MGCRRIELPLTPNPVVEMNGVLKTQKVDHMTVLSRGDLPQFLNNLATGDINKQVIERTFHLLLVQFS